MPNPQKRIGLRGNIAVGGTNARNVLPKRGNTVLNLTDQDLDRLEELPFDVQLGVTKRRDPRIAVWTDPSRIKQKPE